MSEKCTDLCFDLIKPLGNHEGRNSKVFLAKDRQLNTELVIKRVPKKDFNNQDDYFAETRNLYASKHPNVMKVQYASQDDKYIYLAMPYHKNGSINSLINSRFLTVREIIKYSLEFLSGLHYVHLKGLIHFDVKPTNIIINDSNKALITDFGLSKHINKYGVVETSDLIYYMIDRNYKNCIYITQSKGVFNIVTKRVNMDTLRENKITKFCKSGYNTEEETLEEVGKIIKNYTI